MGRRASEFTQTEKSTQETVIIRRDTAVALATADRNSSIGTDASKYSGDSASESSPRNLARGSPRSRNSVRSSPFNGRKSSSGSPISGRTSSPTRSRISAPVSRATSRTSSEYPPSDRNSAYDYGSYGDRNSSFEYGNRNSGHEYENKKLDCEYKNNSEVSVGSDSNSSENSDLLTVATSRIVADSRSGESGTTRISPHQFDRTQVSPDSGTQFFIRKHSIRNYTPKRQTSFRGEPTVRGVSFRKAGIDGSYRNRGDGVDIATTYPYNNGIGSSPCKVERLNDTHMNGENSDEYPNNGKVLNKGKPPTTLLVTHL